jgi:hypothetical protein
VPYTALHTYYLSPSGSDANSGTSPAAPWLTPQHNVQCGDVVVAAAGNYPAGTYGTQFGANNWGAVSSCPSTSGGIDGKGGVYFAVLLCAGPAITSCTISGGGNEAVRVDQSNWAVEGFSGTQQQGSEAGCFSATSESAANLHHIAFINDMALNCSLAGFGSYSWHRL